MKAKKLIETLENLTDKKVKLVEKKVEPKFKWKRVAATIGRYRSFDNNDLRGYSCRVISLPGYEVLDDSIGGIFNVSSSNFSQDLSKEWQINITAKGPRGNIVLKKRFPFEQHEQAMKYFTDSFTTILTTDQYPEFKAAILALGRLKPIEPIVTNSNES